jgi:hypothetical protein
MPLLNATLSGDTPLISTTTPLRAMQLIFAPAGHVYYVGDSSSVSSTKGIPVPTAGPSVSIGPFTSGAINLDQWYAKGTDTDVISFQYTPEE